MAATDFILKDNVIIAMAEIPYVIDGPKVQYETQAEKIMKFDIHHSKIWLPTE